ncbi:MAG: Gliding motility-associated C-terminal protein [Mucilaginibacter sp.]|nr:Gliding motility-associated C-terminal protein [Mucilaginibacter sp.]
MRFAPIKFILLITYIVLAMHAGAQTCSGSLGDPVVNITFGAGADFNSSGGPLAKDVTTLKYTSAPCNEDDAYYGLVSNIRGCHGGTWHVIWNDHTGDPNGYFMLINGPDGAQQVYSQRVDGSKLCPNTTYEFAAWIMNVLVLTDTTANWVLPNLTFTIETAGGKVLKTVNIGDIPETVHPQWNQYGTFFTTPSDGSDLIIRLFDNQTVLGSGNDFAVDDITFRPCGPIIKSGFDSIDGTTDKQLCAGYSGSFLLTGSQAGYPNPAYQWQQNLNDGKGWADIGGATDTVLHVNLNAAAAGSYQYRMGVLSGNLASAACRIYAHPLTVSVYPFPKLAMPATTSVCQSQPLQLSVQQGESYLWTGPNGFSSIQASPVINAAATPVNDGVYTVMVTTHGCPTFVSTTVKVFPELIGIVTKDTVICEGGSVNLSAGQSQGATYFNWTPSTGLDKTTGPNVNATPAKNITYTVTIGNGGCRDITQAVTVTVLQKPVANAGLNKKIEEGASVALHGSVIGTGASYYWTPADHLDHPNSLTPIANPIDNTIYTLHVIAPNNCGEDISNVFVRVFKKITIPNTFSPNDDGINDYWDIKNLITYPECSVSIFNRYGQPVYQSTGYNKPWDGKNNGAPQPGGTYYYVIDLKNNTPKLAGWVLIVR